MPTTFVDRTTGEVVEVFDVTPDGFLFVGPPGDAMKARLVPEDQVEPPFWKVVAKEGFVQHDLRV